MTTERYAKSSHSLRTTFNNDAINVIYTDLKSTTKALEHVLNGDKSLTKACKDEGLNTLRVRNLMLLALSIEQPNEHINLRDTFHLEDYISGDEQFYMDVFGIEKYRDLELLYEYMPEDSYQTMLYMFTDNSLSSREKAFLEYRYIDNETLESIGKKVGITRERVRQILGKGLRKMKHPNRARILKMGITQWDNVKELYVRSAQQKAQELALQMLEKLPKPISVDNVTLADMNLSLRTYNALHRAGFKTLEDLKYTSIEELAKIRNMGKKSVDEIVLKLKDYGIIL